MELLRIKTMKKSFCVLSILPLLVACQQPTPVSTQIINLPKTQVENISTSSQNLITFPLASANNFVPVEKLPLTQPVLDLTHTLTVDEQQQLSAKIQKLWVHDKLVQTGVILVPTTGDIFVFDYCMAVAKRWKLGSKDQNNGLLMCFAMQDKKMYILTGTGIEQTLTNEKVKHIIDNTITPYFRQAKYNEGINMGLDKMVSELKNR